MSNQKYQKIQKDDKNQKNKQNNLSECPSPDDLKTHLANERTFLAWCRTSISLIIFGFFMERFDLLASTTGFNNLKNASSKNLKIVVFSSFILAGIIIFVSGWRFLRVRQMIKRGEIFLSIFPELMVIISMIGILSMVILLVLS